MTLPEIFAKNLDATWEQRGTGFLRVSPAGRPSDALEIPGQTSQTSGPQPLSAGSGKQGRASVMSLWRPGFCAQTNDRHFSGKQGWELSDFTMGQSQTLRSIGDRKDTVPHS